MLQSQLFTKTIREVSKDEKSINSKFLIKAGFVDKLMAGVYSYLPLGFLVLKKIENIIREEMNRIGGQELFLPSLHPKENWKKTGRWDSFDNLFRFTSYYTKQDYALGATHEEIVVPLARNFISSYKDLPQYVYQIQNKFRDEKRAKAGILRGREFLMKDLYSFHANEKDLDQYYEKVKRAYFIIFKRCGLEKQTFLTLASGGSFSPYSHEFQAITQFGEDTIYFCKKCEIAVNKEIIDREKYQCPKCQNKRLEIKKAIEAGNIFKLKDRFSKPFNFTFTDKDGKKKPVLMGCYGIGLGRLMGAVVEISHDEKGIIWPESIAPYQIHLIRIENSPEVKRAAEKLYKDLQKQGEEVLYDDREDKSAGEKFMDADLIGIPKRLVVSEKTLAKSSVEVKKRNEKTARLIKTSQIKQYAK